MKDARGEARKEIAAATSSAVAMRPSGCEVPQSASVLSTAAGDPSLNRSADARSIGVSTEPGLTLFTRTP